MSFPLYKKERERRFRAFPSDSNPADTSATVQPIDVEFCVMVEL